MKAGHTPTTTTSHEEKKKAERPATETKTTAPANARYGRHMTMPLLLSDTYADVALPELREFDLSQIANDATVVAVGKRRTGKSWVFREIMHAKKDAFTAGIVFSQTDELNKFWRAYIPAKFIYKRFSPTILNLVFERQKKILNSNRLTEAEKEKYAPFFILLDDVISDERIRYDPSIMELFVAGRHYKLFVLITTQYAKSITPVLRGNTDYCFIMRTIQKRQLESLWEDFAGFITRDAWQQIVEDNTYDNEVLVIDTCAAANTAYLDMLYWFKAVDPGPFLVGSPEYWAAGQSSSQEAVPPMPGNDAASSLLTVADCAPPAWRGAMSNFS